MIKGKFIDNLPKVYGIYTGGFLVFIILMAIAEQAGMSAKLIGIFRFPDFKLYPAPNTIDIPPNDRFGPTANSNPDSVLAPTIEEIEGKNFPFSIPATSTIHSTIPVTASPSAKRLSHCQP